MKIKIINPNTTLRMTREIEEAAKNMRLKGRKSMP